MKYGITIQYHKFLSSIKRFSHIYSSERRLYQHYPNLQSGRECSTTAELKLRGVSQQRYKFNGINNRSEGRQSKLMMRRVRRCRILYNARDLVQLRMICVAISNRNVFMLSVCSKTKLYCSKQY